MTDSKVLIYDYTSLVRLNEALDYCGDSLLKLLQDIDGYLQSMLQTFENQRDYFKQLLEEAEQELREAKEDLSNCLSSQEWDEEDGCYHPSCSCEQSNVESAQRRRDECLRKYETAERIVSDCRYEIDQYQKTGGILTPPGGEKMLQYTAKEHTDEAILKMDEILNVVVCEYLGRSLVETNPNESLPSNKAQKFQEAAEEVKNKQKAEASSNKIVDADVTMVCPYCRRPLPICLCARENQRVR